MQMNRKLPRVDASRFSMVPRPDIPRSTFNTTHTHKTTFQAGYLIPIELAEVLPGDTHQGKVTIFARLATPIFPIMDNMTLETFFFFVPKRLLWPNFVKMMGERANPADSISYTIPQITPTVPQFAANHLPGSLFDYMGLQVLGELPGLVEGAYSYSALPFRAYNFIWNEWFRDQNLQNSVAFNTGNGPDTITDYAKLLRNKKHDYFTSALPWPLKGGVEVSSPLAGNAWVKGIGILSTNAPIAGNPTNVLEAGDVNHVTDWGAHYHTGSADELFVDGTGGVGTYPKIYADLSTATGVTINALRLAVQTQRLLERDARSGTRYTELLRAHFGVEPEDTRLQRPEYIGGGKSPINTQAIPQTSATLLTGSTTPLGHLGAAATAADQHSFSYSAKEHGYIIGLVQVTADITYQRGLHRLWTRRTRYDFYWPVFAHLGEQIIRNDEIYAQGIAATDAAAFGYQERWAEYRHRPSRITGLFRSAVADTIDQWHLSEEFAALPTLNNNFIISQPPFERVIAGGEDATNMQILFDSVFNIRTTRAMPMFSVPGMMDHF